MTLAKLELWALRSLAALAILGLVAWRIYAAGERHVQVKWDLERATAKLELETLNAKHKLESANRQNDVLLAEAAAGKAASDLADYRRTHPMRGSLNGLLASFCSSDPGSGQGAGNKGAATAGEAGKLLLTKGAADLERRLNETDELLAEADSINRSYAICLATRPPVP